MATVAFNASAVAADGAVQFPEKLGAAVEQFESNLDSRVLAVNRAIYVFIAIIVNAGVPDSIRAERLYRRWVAFEVDDISSIEYLSAFFGAS